MLSLTLTHKPHFTARRNGPEGLKNYRALNNYEGEGFSASAKVARKASRARHAMAGVMQQALSVSRRGFDNKTKLRKLAG